MEVAKEVLKMNTLRDDLYVLVSFVVPLPRPSYRVDSKPVRQVYYEL